MLYAALGDSITYGYDAASENVRFVTRVQRALGLKRDPMHVFLNAKPGWTSRQLVKSLPNVPDCIWDEAKLITILVGGNDMLRSAPWILDGNHARCVKIADGLQKNLMEVVDIVRRPKSRILLATVYNPFPNSLPAQEGIQMLNRAIRHVANRKRVRLVDVASLFAHREHLLIEGYRNGEIRDIKLRGNPIHPNDRGHAIIAKAFISAYRQAGKNLKST